MRIAILLSALFAAFVLTEISFLHAFTGFISEIPLVYIAGMIIMQRVGIEEGVAWFIALAVFRADPVALIIAGIGPVSILQIFTTRSVYALLGFGAVVYTVATIVVLAIGGSIDGLFGSSLLPPHAVIHAVRILLLLLPGLFFGVLIVRSIERRIRLPFFLRSHS